jgi:hypothetical protein
MTPAQRRTLQTLKDAGGELVWWPVESGGMPALRTLTILIERGWIDEIHPPPGGAGMVKWRLTRAGAAALGKKKR